jgi:hypothetical protein
MNGRFQFDAHGIIEISKRSLQIRIYHASPCGYVVLRLGGGGSCSKSSS